MNIYENNDIKNPKYLFHGSPKLLETIEPRQSFDSGNNHEHTKGSTQYKCHDSIKPIYVVKVKFADYKNYYIINKDMQEMHNI